MFQNMLPRNLLNSFKDNKRRYIFLILGIISSILCGVFSCLHYMNIFYGNPVTWAGWIISIIFMIIAFAPKLPFLKKKLRSYFNLGTLLFIMLGAFFIISHLWNFNTAPWNKNGLFDDASWEIYFAKAYIFTGHPFQPAYFLLTIARELLHHYYITVWFKAFGYNLIVFNCSLIFLSLVTFIFTTMLIQKLFNNYIVTIASAIVFNFLPLEFIETFVGHHYAPMVPLMMVSMYFLYTGFKNKSYLRIYVSSLFAALSLSTAVMGKQYLYGLAAALIAYLVLNFRRSVNKKNFSLATLFVIGFVISAMPMLIYIVYNYADYALREKSYADEFFSTYRTQGLQGIRTLYFDRLLGIFFSKMDYYREFMPDFKIIPIAYYFLLVPGFLIAFIKRRYEIIILALVPVAGAFLAGGFDFRVLHAAPYWIILMAFTMNEVLKMSSGSINSLGRNQSKMLSKNSAGARSQILWFTKFTVSSIALALSITVLLIGLVPCVTYLDKLSKTPNAMYLFPHRDVGVCRYIRDIVAGVPNPSAEMRWNDFNKIQGIPEPNYDCLVCQRLGYAIAHTFLEDYGDEQILSFSNELPYNLLSPADILSANISAIEQYPKTTKDLKMIWETSDLTNDIITKFSQFSSMGTDETVTSQIEGSNFTLYILTIKNKNIDKFKQQVTSLHL